MEEEEEELEENGSPIMDKIEGEIEGTWIISLSTRGSIYWSPSGNSDYL